MIQEAQLDAIGTVTLDASGNGSVVLRPGNAHESWTITSTVVRQLTTVVKIPVCQTFVGSSGVLGGQAVDTTYTGNNDSSDTLIEVNEGSFLTVVWTGGDVGSQASVSVRGTRRQRR